MSTKDNILRQIANILIMYAYHIKENGLLRGKTGAMLYLYLYARHSGDEICYDFAGELLDGLMKSTVSAPSSFEDGIAGLGWCVGRLMRNDIVGGRPNSALAGIDHRLLDAMGHNSWSETWNELIYFADRIKDFKLEGNKGCSYLVISYINWQINDRQLQLSDNRKRAVIRFIDCLDNAFGKSVETERLRNVLGISPLGLRLHEEPVSYAEDTSDSRIKNYISLSFLSMVFDESNPAHEPDITELFDFVKKQQLGLTPDDLFLSDGFAGLGVTLLNNIIINN